MEIKKEYIDVIIGWLTDYCGELYENYKASENDEYTDIIKDIEKMIEKLGEK